MAPIDDTAETLSERLAKLAEQCNVVGASVAIQQGDRIIEAATGKTNVRTGVEVTTDTIFQIGSISKTYTATLILQLVDEGLLDLDAPVQKVLPEFSVADKDAAATITTRQLLSHTSGVDGDVFDDFGRGDECVERYVAGMSTLAQTQPVGAFFSYCNAGYVLLGRIVEKLRGCGWDAALRTHLLEPLGLTDTVTLPEEAILRRAAIGHLPTGEDKSAEPAPVWHLSRALGPAGVIAAPAHEVLAFARMHLDEGRAASGAQVLSPAAAKTMRELAVTLPDPYTLGDAWGLGWILYKLAPPLVFGHDGATIGQQAYLRIVPDADLAVCLLTNGLGGGALFDALVRPLLGELAGASLTEVPTPPAVAPQVDRQAFVGEFERSGVRMTISRDEADELWLDTEATGPLASISPKEPARQLAVLDESTLLTAEADPRIGHHIALKFLEPTPAGYRYVHLGGRATPRVGDVTG
jgi:CubicO group peptidase (beta-lactamase class C family)